MTLRQFYLPILLLTVTLLLAACASENADIVNPPPGSVRIGVRLLNLVGDGQQRKLVLEKGFQTGNIAPGGISETINAPSDSSFVEIVAGTVTELRTPERVRFAQQSIYDVIAVGKANGVAGFDTIVVSNANRSLTTVPVAQVRTVNAFFDSLSLFDVRIGCPNGTPVSSQPLGFKGVSLYREIPPGNTVFSIQRVRDGVTTSLGTFECTLAQHTPYSIIIYPVDGSEEPQIMLIDESDLTANAQRLITQVQERDASVRICNLTSAACSATLDRTGQTIATNVMSQTTSAYASVPTCEQETADVISVLLADGRKDTDSTSLVLRGRYSLVVADQGSDAKLIIVPPLPVLYDVAGKSIIRVVDAVSTSTSFTVSTGARFDPGNPNNISSGIVLAANVGFTTVSNPVVIEPGILPLTITSSATPTSILSVSTTKVEPDHSYILIVSTDATGSLVTYVLDENDQPGALNAAQGAGLVRFVDADPSSESIRVDLGNVVQNGRLFYRNSLTTSVPFGVLEARVGATQFTTNIQPDIRTLLVYTQRENTHTLFEVSSSPLRHTPGQSERRVINATADLDLVTITYDTLYAQYPDSSEKVASNVPFGASSNIHVLMRDRRGSMYVYDATTRKLIYTLPIFVGPLGNNYSFIVVGRRESGYEVVVLQEF